MPGSSLWREPALQAGPPGLRAASSSSSCPRPRGSDTCREPRAVSARTGSSGQSTRGLNALQQNHIWLQPTGKPNNRRQSTKNQHVYVHTHALLPPSSPAVFNRLRVAFWALWVMMLKPALQVLLRLLFQPSPGSRAQFLPPSLTCGCLTCFQQLQGSLYTGRTLHSTSEPAFLIPYRSRYNCPLVRDAASQAEIPVLERKGEGLTGEGGAPAEVAPLAMAPRRDALGAHSSWQTHTEPQQAAEHLSILAPVLGSLPTLQGTVTHTL